jgi:hypothetical protein
MMLAVVLIFAWAVGAVDRQSDIHNNDRNLRQSGRGDVLTYAVGAKGSQLGSKPHVTAKSDDDIDIALRQLEDRTQAEMQSDSTKPSSLIENDIEQKLRTVENDAYLEAIRKARAMERKKRQGNPNAAPASFLEEQDADPESLGAISKELTQMKESAQAELVKLHAKLGLAQPSSLLQEDETQSSFADLDAKLKDLQQKRRLELAKLNAELANAAPSSLLERGSLMQESFADLDADLETTRERTQEQVYQLAEEIDQPTLRQSLLERRVPATISTSRTRIKDLEKNAYNTIKELYPITIPAPPSSFVEEGAPDSFADLDAKLKALEEKTKAELVKLQSDTVAPSSFAVEGAPDSFADLDA